MGTTCPPGVTISTSGSQSQYDAQAAALDGDAKRIPAASAAATTTRFNLCSLLTLVRNPTRPAIRQRYSEPFRSPLKDLLSFVCPPQKGLDADVFAREAECGDGQRCRPDQHHQGQVGEFQAVQQRGALVVEGGKAKRRLRQLEVRPHEADQKPARQQEADQARV